MDYSRFPSANSHAFAQSYEEQVKPFPLPSDGMKLLLFVVFFAVAINWHQCQHAFQMEHGFVGEPGTQVSFKRTLPGSIQVMINAVVLLATCAYGITVYVYHDRILAFMGPILHPRKKKTQLATAYTLFVIALVSLHWGEKNWVAMAGCVATFLAFLMTARDVQEEVPAKTEIGLGPSNADEDRGMSFHVDGSCVSKVEAGEKQRKTSTSGENNAQQGVSEEDAANGVVAYLVSEAAGHAISGPQHFAAVPMSRPGDAAAVVRSNPDGTYSYEGPCGRQLFWRPDMFALICVIFGFGLKDFLIGSGDFNQCAGPAESIAALIYIPFGYTAYAVFGFRTGHTIIWNYFFVLGLSGWPLLFFALGGKGCGTLKSLFMGDYLPQIWDPTATEITFSRGYAECSEYAYSVGGEAFLVLSSGLAAWVHIMSNFSFLIGMPNGWLRALGNRFQMVVIQ